jgi:hypothetical protein
MITGRTGAFVSPGLLHRMRPALLFEVEERSLENRILQCVLSKNEARGAACHDAGGTGVL